MNKLNAFLYATLLLTLLPTAALAGNSKLECGAQFSVTIGARIDALEDGGPDKTDVGFDVFKRYVRMCRRGKSLIDKAAMLLRKQGFVHPEIEIARLQAKSDRVAVAAALHGMIRNTSFQEIQEMTAALEVEHDLQHPYGVQYASLVPVAPTTGR